MNESHFLRNALLVVVGLLVAGYIAVWAVGELIHFFFYLLLGALVIGGGVYLYHRAKTAITGGKQRQIRR
jgi:predicted metal-binding membrane protein